MSKRLLVIVAVVLLVVLAAGAGYVAGVRAVMQAVCNPVVAEDGVKPRSIPYPGLNCDLCRETMPDWWCFLGGCPW